MNKLENLLGIDFEEWYHPELIQKNIQIKNKTAKLVKGIDKILDWLSSDDKDIEGITDDDLAEEDELFDDD